MPGAYPVEDEIASAARQLAASGVHLIDLTLGEDPEFFRTDDAGISRLEHLVRRVSQETGLPVMISPGVVSGESLGKLSEAGATQFGSGWAWLVSDPDGKLSVTKTANAEILTRYRIPRDRSPNLEAPADD